jgi:hypothetical protein
LTVLLVLELCLLFIAAALAAKGLTMALAITETLVLGVLALFVILSHRRGAIVLILIGLAATLTSLGFRPDWPRVASSVLRCGGTMLAFAALTWVVWRAVHAPAASRFIVFKAPLSSI